MNLSLPSSYIAIKDYPVNLKGEMQYHEMTEFIQCVT